MLQKTKHEEIKMMMNPHNIFHKETFGLTLCLSFFNMVKHKPDVFYRTEKKKMSERDKCGGKDEK